MDKRQCDVEFGRPKRHGVDYFVKAVGGARRSVTLKDVALREVKHIDDTTIWTFGLRPADRKDFTCLEGEIKRTVRNNIRDWFKNTVSESLIDEYYVNNIIFDDAHGLVLKVRTTDDCNETFQVGSIYDVRLRIRGLLFRPTTYHVEFYAPVIGAAKRRLSYNILSDDDNNDEKLNTDTDIDDDPIPSYELEDIREELVRDMAREQARLAKVASDVESLCQSLAAIDPQMLFTPRDLDRASQLVERARSIKCVTSET